MLIQRTNTEVRPEVFYHIGAGTWWGNSAAFCGLPEHRGDRSGGQTLLFRRSARSSRGGERASKARSFPSRREDQEAVSGNGPPQGRRTAAFSFMQPDRLTRIWAC